MAWFEIIQMRDLLAFRRLARADPAAPTVGNDGHRHKRQRGNVDVDEGRTRHDSLHAARRGSPACGVCQRARCGIALCRLAAWLFDLAIEKPSLSRGNRLAN